MGKITYSFVLATALLSISAAPGHSAPQEGRGTEHKVGAPLRPPEILAVRFHHDMCPHCKGLKPKFQALDALLADAPVLLVTLDLTTPGTQNQAAMLASSLGLESVWTGDLSRIGTVVFLD